MADQHTYKFLPEDKCLSESQLFDYIDGKLKASDMHFIEKHILSCGFCSDALEGLEKVKHRDKVAAFIPATGNKEEEKEEPKVIPLNPNRKYYALAAGLVVILGITLFFQLSTSDDLAGSKMADRGSADSISILSPPQKQSNVENGIARFDSSSSSSKLSGEADTRTANDDQTLKKAIGAEGPSYFDIAPATDAEYRPTPKVSEESVIVTDKNTDGDLADDFVNIVDEKAAAEENVGADDSKNGGFARLEQQQVLAEKKNKTANRAKDRDGKKAEKPELAKEDMPVTLTAPSGAAQGTTAPTISNAPADIYTTVPASTGSATTGTLFTNADSTVTTKSQSERELDLSYENGNKMLASGQATASLALYDEVLKNPAHPHYKDAQWKKAEALIQLKRIDEAKKLLNEIASKPGKYKEQAIEKLKGI